MLLSEEKKRQKRDYGAKKGEKISSTTLSHIFTTLRMIFNKAKKWGFIEHNPVAEVEQPKHKAKEIEVPAFEEFSHIESVIMKAGIREKMSIFIRIIWWT